MLDLLHRDTSMRSICSLALAAGLTMTFTTVPADVDLDPTSDDQPVYDSTLHVIGWRMQRGRLAGWTVHSKHRPHTARGKRERSRGRRRTDEQDAKPAATPTNGLRVYVALGSTINQPGMDDVEGRRIAVDHRSVECAAVKRVGRLHGVQPGYLAWSHVHARYGTRTVSSANRWPTRIAVAEKYPSGRRPPRRSAKPYGVPAEGDPLLTQATSDQFAGFVMCLPMLR